jgi:hypothetical protein
VNSRKISRLSLAVAIVFSQLTLIGTFAAVAVNDVSSSCAIGSSSSCPAQSPQEIVNLYGTTANGTYWLNVNGVATQTYLILNTGYPESGGLFLAMKGTKTSTTFSYSSNYWTTQNTLSPSSLSDDVSADAKFDAFNYLPVTRIIGVFKDRSSQAFNASGSGEYGANSFAGHVWTEAITSQTMLNRFDTNSNVAASSSPWTRYAIYRETNSSGGKLVFPYQTGYYQYGYDNTSGQSYRWGVTFNNESSQGSNDSVSGIGLASYSAAGILSYSDSLSFSVNGSSGANNGSTQTLQSGFQIWGKMAAGTLAAPTSLTQSQQSNNSTRISWGAVASATDYVVQYKTSAQSWSQGSTLRVSNPSASPSALLTGLTDSSYNFRVWARGANNTYGSASSSLTLTLDQVAPTFTNSTSSTLAENLSSSTNALSVTTNESTTVTINVGADAALFTVVKSDSTTARIRFLDSPDFESPADVGADNVYELTIRAMDAVGNYSDQSISISVTNVNEAPTITINSSATTHSVTQAENISSIINYTATDFDAGTSLTWSLSSTDAADFSINSSTGVLSFASSPDFEAPVDSGVNNIYDVIVTVSDGTLSDSQSLTVTITNANEGASITAPTISSSLFKGVVETITVTINVAGKVRFFVGGKRISTCKDRATSGNYPNNIATCLWKPPVTGRQVLTATLTPTDSTFSASTSAPTVVQVQKRITTR